MTCCLPVARTFLAAALVAAVAAGCNQPPSPAVPSAKPTNKAVSTAKKGKSFQLKFTDKAGKEKVADLASKVVVKVNGKPVETKVTSNRVLLSVESKPTDIVEVETGQAKVAFHAKDITGDEDKANTIWLMPWGDKKFLGQPGPDTEPMKVLKGRATIVPLDREVTDAQLQRVYVGPYQVPRHLCAADGKSVMLDQSFVFYLGAAKAKGDTAPPLRLFTNVEGGQVMTVKMKKWADAIPTGDEPPTMREETFAVAQEDVDGASTVEAVADPDAWEKDTLKLVEGFFPTP